MILTNSDFRCAQNTTKYRTTTGWRPSTGTGWRRWWRHQHRRHRRRRHWRPAADRRLGGCRRLRATKQCLRRRWEQTNGWTSASHQCTRFFSAGGSKTAGGCTTTGCRAAAGARPTAGGYAAGVRATTRRHSAAWRIGTARKRSSNAATTNEAHWRINSGLKQSGDETDGP